MSGEYGTVSFSHSLQVIVACAVQVFGGVVHLSLRGPSSTASRTEPSSQQQAACEQGSACTPVFKYLPAEGLPPLHLIYVKDTAGQESGTVHAPVKQRFLDSEPQCFPHSLKYV